MNILQVDARNARKLLEVGKALNDHDANSVLNQALDALAEKIVRKRKKRLDDDAQKEWREQADDTMLFPTSFDESNVVFGPPAGKTEEEIYSLSAARIKWGDENAILSCWKPNIAQIKMITSNGRVWIATMGDSLAPLCVCSDNPIKKDYVTVRDEP